MTASLIKICAPGLALLTTGCQPAPAFEPEQTAPVVSAARTLADELAGVWTVVAVNDEPAHGRLLIEPPILELEFCNYTRVMPKRSGTTTGEGLTIDGSILSRPTAPTTRFS